MKLCEVVKVMKLENRVNGEQVYCPECNLSIAEGAEKTVAGKFVRHTEPCHRNWRKTLVRVAFAQKGVIQ